MNPTKHEIEASIASLHVLSDLIALLPAKHETPDTQAYKYKEKEYNNRVKFVQKFINHLITMLEEAWVPFSPEELIGHGLAWFAAQNENDDRIVTEIEKILNESLNKLSEQKYK